MIFPLSPYLLPNREPGFGTPIDDPEPLTLLTPSIGLENVIPHCPLGARLTGSSADWNGPIISLYPGSLGVCLRSKRLKYRLYERFNKRVEQIRTHTCVKKGGAKEDHLTNRGRMPGNLHKTSVEWHML